MPFEYPKIHSFPPFFTKQPNEKTWLAQRQQWIDLILAKCKEERIWTLTQKGEPSPPSPSEGSLFTNPEINRSLESSAVEEIFQTMVANGDITESGSGQYYVNWNKPDTWASMILEWVERTGQTTVLTLYEISEGDATLNEPFHEIHLWHLERALKVLEKRNRAQLIKQDGQVVGVKIQ